MERGMFNKYRVVAVYDEDVGAHFVIRPGHDAYSDAAAAAAPRLVERLRNRHKICKLVGWGGNARSAADPSWPVYGDPLPDAVALPLGPPVDVQPGEDMATAVAMVDDPEVVAALRAYADACAADIPELAADLWRITGALC